MNNIVVLVLMVLLAGCAASAKTHAVRGVSGIEVDCSGLGSGWDRCLKRAAKECGAAGYKVVVRSDDAQEGDFPFGFNPAGYLTRTMIVICR
ncbi:hypothetical protein [Pseudomonas granadensis]|uniref:hypothetical protein n=1 Tax=Pseudomonas granadensis TaxID=1421430 RepID=UPI001EF0DED1|nr:hypothetical protein [Pseudomonas granadensis]